jgi:hypothetical protein
MEIILYVMMIPSLYCLFAWLIYIIPKEVVIYDGGEWTTEDDNMQILISALWPIGILVILLFIYEDKKGKRVLRDWCNHYINNIKENYCG